MTSSQHGDRPPTAAPFLLQGASPRQACSVAQQQLSAARPTTCQLRASLLCQAPTQRCPLPCRSVGVVCVTVPWHGRVKENKRCGCRASSRQMGWVGCHQGMQHKGGEAWRKTHCLKPLRRREHCRKDCSDAEGGESSWSDWRMVTLEQAGRACHGQRSHTCRRPQIKADVSRTF